MNAANVVSHPRRRESVSATKGREIATALRRQLDRLEADPEDLTAWRVMCTGATAMIVELDMS